ncbi:DUF4231 domain-containing protein [Embleya sp. NPDC059259]|uniref:DUF4231 domain-containing protein n=1 Tax=unclassified Embleya TaxID=2699296 RepID=UPI00368B5874
MARSLDDDDAASRLQAADAHVNADAHTTLYQVRRTVAESEEDLARWRFIARVRWTAMWVTITASTIGFVWTVTVWGDRGRYIKADIVCAALMAASAVAALATTLQSRRLMDRSSVEDVLRTNREALRTLGAAVHPALDFRRRLYREDVPGIIEHYQSDSRKYRRVHNGLQSLIMVGSAATTTVAALETGKELTWQNLTIVGIGFAITLAAAFTGYYKYRERSYFLQQTADAIEEEFNTFTLGVGEYRQFGPDQDNAALAHFTHRVEGLRSEQRRRQQQLDQPADQPAPSGPAV